MSSAAASAPQHSVVVPDLLHSHFAAADLLLQFFIGMCLSAIFWATGVVKRPQLDAKVVSSSCQQHSHSQTSQQAYQQCCMCVSPAEQPGPAPPNSNRSCKDYSNSCRSRSHVKNTECTAAAYLSAKNHQHETVTVGGVCWVVADCLHLPSSNHQRIG